MSLILYPERCGDLPSYSFYGGTVTLLFDKSSWKYYKVEADGFRTAQYGVTNILKIIDKSEVLIPWALKRSMEKLKRLLKEKGYVTGYLETKEPTDTVNILFEEILDDIIAQAKKAPREILEDAGEVGHQAAHDWVERYIKAILEDQEEKRLELLSKLPSDERAANACIAALSWMHEHDVKWIQTERKCYSRKHGYAGTADGLARVSSCSNKECCPTTFKDRLTLVDWKTSNYLYLEYVFQTAAYQQAIEEETGEQIEDIWIIRLGKEDGEFEPWHISDTGFISDALLGFLNALNLYKSVQSIENRISDIKDAKRAREKEKVMQERQIRCLDSATYKGVRKKRGCNGQDKMCSTCSTIYLDKHPEMGDNI